MKAIYDRPKALAEGLDAIRTQFQLPAGFPPEVEAVAAHAASQTQSGRLDRTAVPFVTLDPTSSTDLDQAFWIEAAGSELVLRYAIADVGSFVAEGGPVEAEAWRRGETIYLPDGKVSLYPPVLSEGAASLLPDDDKRAIIFNVRVAPDGATSLDGVERATVRSRAKLGYATVRPDDLPATFSELARRIEAAEEARGASRVDPPQQQVVEKPDGSFSLEFRPMDPAERANAALSLAANLAIADMLYKNHEGLFRVMPEPDGWAIRRLRHSAQALGVEWPESVSLEDMQRGLDPNIAKDAAFMLAIRRAGVHASYAPFRSGQRPWHSAMRATYVHATAPLRRLADRYVIDAALAVASGGKVPDPIVSSFDRLADVMNRADSKAAQVDSAVLELAESVTLAQRTGETFKGVVTDIDERGARIQLCEPAVTTRVAASGLQVGAILSLRLDEADPARRLTRFSLA